MRFAWQRKNTANPVSVKQGLTHPNTYLRRAFNWPFWIVLLLTFIEIIDYRTGFIAFTIIISIRLGANLYLNNVLKPEQAESFPFRA
jgi:hypothetical protein